MLYLFRRKLHLLFGAASLGDRWIGWWQWLLLSLVVTTIVRVPGFAATSPSIQPDIVVYGTTPAGIAFSVRAAREGRNVLLIGHSKRLGGMMSYGISAFDTLYSGPRAPIFDELRDSIHRYYREKYGPDSEQLKSSRPGAANTRVESHVAERLVSEMVNRETLISVRRGFVPVSATRNEKRIDTVTFRALQGQDTFSISAKVFVDCSYEGDLAAVTNTPCRIGRESRAEFKEEHAGRIFMRDVTWPPSGVDAAYLESYRKLNITHMNRWSEIIFPQSTGDADRNVQAFCIRMLLTTDTDNSVLITRPEGYDRDEFMARLKTDVAWRTSLPQADVPNQKRYMLQPELIGLQNKYVEGTWEDRRRIIEEHRAMTLKLLYFLQNDESLPAATREGWKRLNLPRDEWPDTGHLPDELYVREARRIIGRETFTEHNARLAAGSGRAPIVADSIGITEWYLDSHACTAERADGSLWEGEFYLRNKTWPGQISLKTVFPATVENLVVPVCLSATHVGFGSMRVEPVWMSVAEASAYAVVAGLRVGVAPARVDAEPLVRRLAKQRFLLTFFNDIEAHREAVWYPAVQYLGTKGFFSSYDARPMENLSLALASEWIRAAAMLRAGEEFDANAIVRRCYALEAEQRVVVSERMFAERISKTVNSSVSNADLENAVGRRLTDGPISRGSACSLLFAALE